MNTRDKSRLPYIAQPAPMRSAQRGLTVLMAAMLGALLLFIIVLGGWGCP